MAEARRYQVFDGEVKKGAFVALYTEYGEYMSSWRWANVDYFDDAPRLITKGWRTADDPERDNWPRNVDRTDLSFLSGKVSVDKHPKRRRVRSDKDLLG